MFYDIDIDKWGRQLLPPVLRRKRLQAFLRVLLLPLQQMKQSFSSYRDSAIGRVNVNGQVIYMEKALNDAFFLTEREIFITDAAGDMSRLYPEPEYTFIVHGDGSSLWTFTFNTDFAKGFCGLMGNPHALGQAVHITSDESVTWDQAYESIGRALGVKPNLVHIATDFLVACDPGLMGPLLGDKSRSVVFDNSKIKRLVPGFCATVRYDQGVRICLDYIAQHPELQTEDPAFDAWCDRVIAAYFSGLQSLAKAE